MEVVYGKEQQEGVGCPGNFVSCSPPAIRQAWQLHVVHTRTRVYTAIEDCMFRKNNSINLEFHRISRQLPQLLWACLRESDETRPHYRLPSVPVIYLCVCHVFVHALFHEHELTENTTDMQVLNLMTSVTFHWPKVFTYYIYMYTTYWLVVE